MNEITWTEVRDIDPAPIGHEVCQASAQPFYCTREGDGHELHVAHGPHDRVVGGWRDGDEKATWF